MNQGEGKQSKRPLGKEKIEGRGEIAGRGELEVETEAEKQAAFEEKLAQTFKGEPLTFGSLKRKAGKKKPKAKTATPSPAAKEPEIGQAEGAGEAPDEEEAEEEPQEEETEEPEEEEEQPEEEEQEEEEPEEKEEEAPKEKEGPEGPAEEEASEETRLKITDRAKKFANDLKKKVVQAAANAAKKLFTKAFWSGVWGFIVAFWPYILAVLVLLILIVILASSCSRQTGKTPLQPLDKQRDEKLVLQFLAAAGDQSAERQLLAKQAVEAKKEVEGLTASANFSEEKMTKAREIIDEIKKLLDEIVELADNEDAVKARTKRINELLDELNTLSGGDGQQPSAGLIPQARAQGNISGQIQSIKNKVNELDKMLEFYQRGHLAVNPKDLDYVRNFEGDRRLIQMLVYLITPKDQGGAGHERLKVKRIFFSYDSERKSVSKETEYELEQGDEPNISAHFSGQAADITEIDCIKCTEIKRRRVGSDKKTKLPPTPIKVAWQTEEGYMKAGGPEAFGQNMHQVFNNLASGAINDVLIQQIADILGVDLDPEKLKGRTFGEMTRIIGLAILKESLGIPGDYELGGNLEDISQEIGRAYLAQALGVPLEGVRGSNEEEIFENIGRAILEEKMGLSAGSLSGKNSQDIFASAGRRQIEESLHLSPNSLATPFSNQEEFKRLLGQGRVETSLGMKPQTFYGNSIEEIKKRLGKDSFQEIFANPNMIDNWLGLYTGTTEDLIQGRLSPNDYNQKVGQKVYQNELAVYRQDQKRAEAFGLSASDLNSLTSGNQNAFISMGKTTIARQVSVSDQEQDLLKSWFDSKQLPAGLDEDYLAGQYGLKTADLGKIFVDDLGREVFSRIGKVRVLDNLLSNPRLQEYLEPVAELKFYLDRLNIIKENLQDLKNSSDPAVREKAQETQNLIEGMLGSLNISRIRKDIKQVQKNIQYIQEKTPHDRSTQENIKAIRKAMDEIIEGREISDFDSLDPGSISARTDLQVGLSKKDILALLTGKKSIDDLAYQIGLKKWEIELDLPEGSLKEAYEAIKGGGFASPDEALLISIGKARLKEYGSVKSRDPGQVDRDLGLPQGTTANFLSGKITENAYYQRVGMGATNNLAAALLNEQLDLDENPNYALKGTDITKLLNGGWFYVALKIGGRGIDEALGLPQGGTLDIIGQTTQPGDVLALLAEAKLGMLAGLNRPISINGDLSYNLGRAKIEEELWLKPNELNDSNLVELVKSYTSSDSDRLSRLDMTFGLSAGDSRKLISGGRSPHDYIVSVGEFLRSSVIYDQISQMMPELKDQELKNIVLGLAEKTGSPQEILEAAGARRLAEVLGLDFPVSIRGNFKDNLGAAMIEDRLGLRPGTFKDNVEAVIKANGESRFEAAFYIERGKLSEARKGDSSYWNENHKNQANLIDAILNISSFSTFQFLTSEISLAQYVDRVGQTSLQSVTVDQLADLMDLEDKYKDAAKNLVELFSEDPGIDSPASQQKLFTTLMGVAGLNLDNMTKFDPGTWERILFVDPRDPDHTGLSHANEIVLEQGKKWLPRWLGMEEKYDPYIDLIYEQASGIENEEKMLEALKKVTGIPDDTDARRFLNGDFRGGVVAWGAAQLVTMYNQEFAAQGFSLTYQEVKNAYFNDPQAESTLAEQAIQAEEQRRGAPISEEEKEAIRNQTIRDSREDARKDVQYKMIDMSLHQLDKNIPAGFTKTMREGTIESKWQMGLSYFGNLLHEDNPNIPPEILNDLKKYFDSSSTSFHDPSALSDSTMSFLDGQMTTWMGDFIQPGTAKALFQYGQTGNLGSPGQEGTLVDIYTDYGIAIVTQWADEISGLPIGATKMIWDNYNKYQTALTAYRKAQTAYNTAKTAESLKELQEAGAALDALKAELITQVITYAFQDQLYLMDQTLGLVPGSSSMLVGMGVQMWLTGAVNPWMIGLFVATNLFGVYRVDIVCSACGYYPGFAGPNDNYDKSCPLKEFDGLSASTFQKNSVLAAQYKVKQLLGELWQMPKVLGDESLLPTQVMTLRAEDVDYYSFDLSENYGQPAERGNSGMWPNDLMWDHIHIGY